MERRGFLKGLFGGVTAAGLLIKARPSDIEVFAAPLAKKEPLIIDSPVRDPRVGAGEHLYNSRGELVAIVTELKVVFPFDDNSVWSESERRFMPGTREFHIKAIGVGSLQ